MKKQETWEDEYHDPISDQEDLKSKRDHDRQTREILDDIEICRIRIQLKELSNVDVVLFGLNAIEKGLRLEQAASIEEIGSRENV